MPGSSWLVAREELKALKRTTIRTFFRVLSSLKLKRDFHYKFNAQDMVLSFVNGSTIFFSELKRIPSDPEFDRIGSYDLTGAWIDEAQEVCKDAKDALQFRFTVLHGDGWVTSPKSLYTCNPSKNWIYSLFWRPLIKEGKKVDGRHFITSLYSDNPYIDHEKYKKNVLKTKNKVKIERLLYGNFEYDDDPSKLFDIDTIADLFTNHAEKSNQWYMSIDVARFGVDKTVFMIWKGLRVHKIDQRPKTSVTDTIKIAKEYELKHGIRRSHIVVDEDGVGGGVVDGLEGCRGFVNNSSAIYNEDIEGKPNYANLKTQCYFELARLAEMGKVGIRCDDEDVKTLITEELEQVKQKDIDKDKKISLVGKEVVKEILGRSPDFSDTLMMRMFYEVAREQEPGLFVG